MSGSKNDPFTLSGPSSRATTPEFLRVLAEELTLERWRRIVRKAVRLAELGDDRCREWCHEQLAALYDHEQRASELDTPKGAKRTAREDPFADIPPA